MEIQLKKRTRKESVKRWSKEDKNLLITVISENPAKFEKPTAQIFYGNIITQHPQFQEYGWKAMRDKLRNLRAAYTKAVDWLKNTGSGLNEEDAETSIRAYLLKICEDFDALENIFATRSNIVPPYVHESADTYNSLTAEMQEIEVCTEAEQPEVGCSYSFLEQLDDVESPPPIPKKRQRVQSNNSTAFLAQVQAEKTAYLREKLDFLKNTEDRKLLLEEQNLELERERMQQDSRLKEMELKFNFELNKMRLEREMALKEKELEEKYKKKFLFCKTGSFNESILY